MAKVNTSLGVRNGVAVSRPNAQLLTTLALLLVILVTLATRLIPAWNLKTIASDVSTYYDMAVMITRGDNVYTRPIFFPYMPYSQFHPELALKLAEAANWRFDFTIKLGWMIGDAAASALIFLLVLRQSGKLSRAVFWSLVWTFNPVSIMVSAYHGNMMEGVAVAILASYAAAEFGRTSSHRSEWWVVSGLLMGIAVALRTFPILMVPAFLVLGARNFREVVIFLVLALLPSILSAAPYLYYSPNSFLHEVGGYGGTTDFGWVAVIRDALTLKAGQMRGSIGEVSDPTKLAFIIIAAITCLALPFFRSRKLAAALMLPPLLFYGFFGAVAAQYLVWVLPLMIVTQSRWTLPYTLLAATAMASFYLMLHPAILLGQTNVPGLEENRMTFVGINLYANAALVVISIAVCVSTLWDEGRAFLRKAWVTENNFVRWLRPVWGNVFYVAGLAALLILLWLPQMGKAVALAGQILRANKLIQ